MNVAYLHFKRAIEKDSECFLCEVENELEQKYLNNYLQELVMDAKARDEIVESRGFCNDHSYKLLIEASKPTTSDGHGVALIIQSVIEQLIRDLANNHRRKKDSSEASHERECPACVYLSNSRERYLEEASGLLSSSNDFLKLIKGSKGFCIFHYSLVVNKINSMNVKGQDNFQLINEVETSNLQRINRELIEYIRRQSYEFSESDRTAIASVLLRSTEKVVGKRGIKMLIEQNPDSRRTVKGG
jgi:hypothetical protein